MREQYKYLEIKTRGFSMGKTTKSVTKKVRYDHETMLMRFTLIILIINVEHYH